MSEAVVSADARERLQALDSTRSFIVQAPAGSGKTELLVQRFLSLLATVDKPEAILAITFTNKAAAEMRERILTALDSARSPRPDEPHKQQTWKLAASVLERDHQFGWNIHETPQRLRVQTIDSLCSGLARRLPVLAGFGAPPGIVQDARPIYTEAARAVLHSIDDVEEGRRVRQLLEHLDGNVRRFISLLSEALKGREQWIKQIVGGAIADRAQLESSLKAVVDSECRALCQQLGRPLLVQASAVLARAAQYVVADGQSPPWALDVQSTGGEVTHPAFLRALGSWALTTTGSVRSKVDKRSGVPSKSNFKDKGDQQTAIEHAEAAKTLLARLRDDLSMEGHLQRAVDLPNERYTDEQWTIVEALSRVLPLGFAHLKLLFANQGNVDFLEYQHRALQALGSTTEPTELLISLDEAIAHILVDEFQDTSRGQIDLLRRLTTDWTNGDGRTLFVVGDPMQSIYRFREAEVGFFLQAWNGQGLLGGISLTPLRLNTNFRSAAPVVDWLNDAFEAAFPKQSDAPRGAVKFSPAQAAKPGSAEEGVIVKALPDADDAREAEAIQQIVQGALERGDESVAILVRSRTHLKEILPALQRAGQSYQAQETEGLAGRQVVRDLYALTRAYLHNSDGPAWLGVLRAPYCGLKLADLHHLFNASTPWQLVVAGNAVAEGLSEDGLVRLRHVTNTIGNARASRASQSLRDTVESLWLALGGPHCLDNLAQLADARDYLSVLSAHEFAGTLRDEVHFESALQELFAAPDPTGDPRVQVMTIHKAKGLEFDSVILPGLHKTPRSNSKPFLITNEVLVADEDGLQQKHLLVAPLEKKQQNDPLFQWLRNLEGERDAHESVRLLYVAATRAKKRLHLLVHANRNEEDTPVAPPSSTLLHHIWPHVASSFVTAETTEDSSEQDRPAVTSHSKRTATPLRTDAHTSIENVVSDSTTTAAEVEIEFEWAGENARHIGTLIHRQIERITREGINAWPVEKINASRANFTAGLRNLGVVENSIDAATDRVVDALTAMVNDERGAWLLADHLEGEVELALAQTSAEGVRELVIDRTFIDKDGIRWIVDYKTGGHEGGNLTSFLDTEQERYSPQLENYAKVMREMDARPIRLGLYFPLIRAWRDWVPENP